MKTKMICYKAGGIFTVFLLAFILNGCQQASSSREKELQEKVDSLERVITKLEKENKQLESDLEDLEFDLGI